MHISDLGVLQWLIGAIFRTLIVENFAESGDSHAAGRHQDNLILLRKLMLEYYKSFGPLERKKMSRLGNIKMTMLGTEEKPRLHAKAAETRHLLAFAKQLTERYLQFLGDRGIHLKNAADQMCRFYSVMASEPMDMSEVGVDLLQLHVSSFLQEWTLYEGHFYYKHHMLWHMAEECGRIGNPKCCHTYPDENENRHMAVVAKSLHGSRSFYTSFLYKACPDAF